MNFTREPIIETVITPKEGYKLALRSSSNSNEEEYLVDAVEVVSFGSALFFRSLERPKAFLLPVQDYEVVETKEARVVLKKASMEKSIKIGSKKSQKAPVEQDNSDADEQPERGKKRRSRRRRSSQSNEESQEAPAPESKEQPSTDPTTESEAPKESSTDKENPTSEAPKEQEEASNLPPPPPRKMIPPPSSLISDHIVRIKDMTSGGKQADESGASTIPVRQEEDESSEVIFEEIERKENEDILKSASADSDFFSSSDEDAEEPSLLDPSEMPAPMPPPEQSEESKGKDLEEHLPDSTGDLFSEENHKSPF